MQDRWRVHVADEGQATGLARLLGIHPLTAQCLLNRGVAAEDEARRFLGVAATSFKNPYDLPDLPQALDRIRLAISKAEPILIFSDSDVDGLTASVIVYETLEALGARVSAVSSNRIEDGYGLPDSLLEELCGSAVGLVIMVDCGTNQSVVVETLSAHGIDTIILDHHLPLEAAARPLALVNPHCKPESDFRELCSAGLALKLAQALGGEGWEKHLDLAALGTLADYSPLRGDSRTIVSLGLSRIIETERIGLRKLCADTAVTQASCESILKKLVPRLNSSGRLGDAKLVWQLLRRQAGGPYEAWAAQVEADHNETKQLQRTIIAQAQQQVNRLHFKDQYVLVVSRDGWHQGLMGPLASQLAQQYGRPAIALAMGEGGVTGSARSIPKVNLLEVLRSCQEVLVRFGGHAQACGLSLSRKNVDAFRDLVNQQAKALFAGEAMGAERWIDLEAPLAAVKEEWVEQLNRLAPFGQGNPKPTVLLRGVTIAVQSPRTALISDAWVSLAARGGFEGCVAESRYDVIATPSFTERQLRLAIAALRIAQPL